MPSSVPSFIIAIGASAGGMEELNAFFDHTPRDGVAYVVIQHLSENFKSRMVELLSRHSELIVEEARNGAEVKRNRVYLIPADKSMTIKDNCLFLNTKLNNDEPNLTIDTFLDSLANEYGKRSIGIILSGLGSDGSRGVISIKQSGGMVIARNPESSQFGSMPASAIATGMVDLILEPELMPEAIEAYTARAEGRTDGHQDERTINAIIDLIKERSPIDFSDYKLSTLLRRTQRRAEYSNLSLQQYLELLKSKPEEMEVLVKDFLISVTSFFRDPEAYEILRQLLPDLLATLIPGEELRIWVAGCATGEEAYSIAILIAEQLTGNFEHVPVKIFATDIDSAAVEHAAKGMYPDVIIRDVSQARLEKFFTKEGDKYRIDPSIRKMVIFAQHDLVKNPPYCRMHLISCRNVLIYMMPELQKKIYAMMLFGLRKNGLLFLGSSENPVTALESLRVISKKWRIFKNINIQKEISFDTFVMPEPVVIKKQLARAPVGVVNRTGQYLLEAMHEAFARERSHLLVCVDEHYQVLRSFGDTTKFLIQQNFTTDFISVLPKPLAIAFSALSREAFISRSRVAVSGVHIEKDGHQLSVSLTVSPLVLKKEEQTLFLVTFSEDERVEAVHPKLFFDEKVYFERYVTDLEEEVEELKKQLHTAYENLETSAENTQSISEELISANEEMQSTNEEMQSVIEELHTINADYRLKNKELSEINDDLNNFFRSNLNGQLFVNKGLRLMRFSPEAVKQINLLETDIGRPLSDISTNIKLETIINDIKSVLAEGRVITKEVETNNGRWYQVMTMPYLQNGGQKPAGAIVTFNDITELKATQLEVDKKNENLLRLNADLDRFVLTASHDLLAPLNNIEGSVAMLNTLDAADPDVPVFINMIGESVKKFRELIKGLATIGRIENDHQEPVDLDELISNIKWSLQDMISQTDATIHCAFKVKQIFFSKKNLRSILYNLVSNAIKYKRDVSPVIRIESRTKGKDVVISIQDNGTGIPKAQLEQIFDIYGRLQQEVEGQGIGLYLARKIVDAAGGEIQVESEPGKGSTFTIRLINQAAV